MSSNAALSCETPDSNNRRLLESRKSRPRRFPPPLLESPEIPAFVRFPRFYTLSGVCASPSGARHHRRSALLGAAAGAAISRPARDGDVSFGVARSSFWVLERVLEGCSARRSRRVRLVPRLPVALVARSSPPSPPAAGRATPTRLF